MSTGNGDLAGFVRGNLADAYRLASIVLDDPILAQAVVRDAVLDAWRQAGASADGDPTAELAAALDAGLSAAIDPAHDPGATPAEAALRSLDPAAQVLLAREFGPWEAASAAGHVEAFRAALDADDGMDGGAAEAALRSLYIARDPGVPAPLALRERLRADQDAAEATAAHAGTERARRMSRSNLRLAAGAVTTLTALFLAVTMTSLIDVRGASVAAADPTGDPASPLAIVGVSAVQTGIPGPDVHVGATQRTLIATFAPSSVWHTPAQQCMADIVGSISWAGDATWVGERAGHTDLIAGDPSSAGAYVSGLGPYCSPGRYATADGGLTWSISALPAGIAADPAWLAFDPAVPGRLLAYSDGRICLSADSGHAWKCHASAVTPIAFDSTGRLVGWTSGSLLQSADDGASWQSTGPGPATRPATAGATAAGVFVGSSDGLWWYPLAAAPSRLTSNRVYSVATLGDSAVVLGADPAGRPWLGTVSDSAPGMTSVALPPDLASIHATGGEVAVNDAGAALAISGPTSAVALATFAY